MNVAIIDDHNNYVAFIKEILYKYGIAERNIFYFTSTTACMQTTINFSLYLLDIDMPEVNGLDMVKQLRCKHTNIIYITAYQNYMSKAFDKNVIAYVVKNEIAQDLPAALDKLFEITNQEKDLQFIYKYSITSIKLSKILYIISELGDCIIFTENTSYRVLNRSLSSIYPKLDKHFIYCSRTLIVNIDYISSIAKNTVVLSNGTKLSISKRRYKSILLTFMQYKFK